MPSEIELGDVQNDTLQALEAKIATDANGDLVIQDSNENNVLKYDESVGEWQFSSQDVTGVGSLSTGIIDNNNGREIYAGHQDGADPETRLDSALSAASAGDTILLESVEYSTDRTISKRVDLEGLGPMTAGSEITGVWTLTDFSDVDSLRMSFDGELIHSGGPGSITRIYDAANGVTVQGDNIAVLNCYGVGVTFESGTSGGLVDSCWGSSTVTDNGSNAEGDVV